MSAAMNDKIISIKHLRLPRRVANALYRGRVRDLQTLSATPIEQLQRIHGIGSTAIVEINRVLTEVGNLERRHKTDHIRELDFHDKTVTQTPFLATVDVMQLPLSTRTRRTLYRSGVRTLSGLLSTTREELARLGGIGEVRLKELDTFLQMVTDQNVLKNEDLLRELIPVPTKSDLNLKSLDEEALLDVLFAGVDERNRA